ncbi:alpha-tectorin-like [Discoglossus pictus]
MNLLNIPFLLLISASQYLSQPPPPGMECPPNSHYDEGIPCAPSCATANQIGLVCNTMELPGCNCDGGYIMKSNNSGTCIPAAECKVTCPKNMHYDPNALGCQPRCTNIKYDPLCWLKIRPQCVCSEGYILSGDRCITYKACKEKLGV